MAMRPYHYNVYYFSQSCEKLRDAIKHGAPELLIIHFKWYGIIAQSTALLAWTRVHYIYIYYYMLTHTHTYIHTHTHTHTHTLHTCCCCNWYFLSYLMCEFLPPSSAGERPVAAEGSLPRVLWGELLRW